MEKKMQKQPTFILSKNKLLQQYNSINGLVDNVSYSFKTNPIVGTILEGETDCLFSVHSHHLLKQIEDKARVLFFAQGWDNEEINTLIEQDVNTFVIDNKTDFNLLLNYIKEHNKTITLYLRMKLKENTIHTGKHFVFGLSSKDVNEIVKEQKENKNIKEINIHFHRKTQNISEWELKTELQQSLVEQTLQTINIINLGGGIPITYNNSKAQTQYIFKKIKELNEWLAQYNIKTIAEPGRYLAGPAIELKVNIKNIYDNNIIIDASIFNAAMDTFIAHVRLQVKEEVDKKKGQAYTIKGCTPDSVDIFRYRVFLKDPKVGDTLTFKNAGAYTFRTDFCGLEEIKTEIKKE